MPRQPKPEKTAPQTPEELQEQERRALEFDPSAFLQVGDPGPEDSDIETARNIGGTRILRRKPRRKNRAFLKQEAVREYLKELPQPGETWHVVSDGQYDYWTLVPVVLELLREPALEFYGSTWTMNRINVLEILQLFDTGRIQKVAMLTGTYFKRRETQVYATLLEGLLSRKQGTWHFRTTRRSSCCERRRHSS